MSGSAALYKTEAIYVFAQIELEKMKRNRYTGPVGWINAKGDGELGIALRCAEINENKARLFAGCGIVSESNPEDELIESNAKFSAMRNALTN